jgi:hypothetical protein
VVDPPFVSASYDCQPCLGLDQVHDVPIGDLTNRWRTAAILLLMILQLSAAPHTKLAESLTRVDESEQDIDSEGANKGDVKRAQSQMAVMFNGDESAIGELRATRDVE